jgi:ATP-dependent DNA helicase DinG
VAEAAVSLKQGAGRLIRSETDRGLLVICDPRLRQMPYGRACRRPCRRWGC